MTVKTYKMNQQHFIVLLFTLILTVPSDLTHKSTRINCLLDKFYSANPLSPTSVQILLNKIHESDLIDKREIQEIPKMELFGHNDIKIKSKIEDLLLNFDKLPIYLQQDINTCFPQNNKALLACQSHFPKDGCESINQYIAVKNCPTGYESLDSVYCLPKCPEGLIETETDRFTCNKPTGFSLVVMGQTNAKSSCPKGYTFVGDFLCIFKCPFGWIDLGVNCEKPVFKRFSRFCSLL